MIKWVLVIALCAALPSPSFAQEEPICGAAPALPTTSESAANVKGQLQGQADFLTKLVGKAELAGQIEAARKQIYQSSDSFFAAQKDAYLAYVFCVLIMKDKALPTPEKLKALQEFRNAPPPGKMGSSAQEQHPADQTALRLDAQRVTQAVPLVDNVQSKIAGEPVFCETAKLTLIVAHNQEGKRPILVNSITLHVEPFVAVAAPPAPNCEIDPLQTKPFGIVVRHTYIFDAAGAAVTGRLIESAQPGAAQPVSAENILKVGNEDRSVSLKPDEVPLAWDVYVTLKNPGLYRVWFSADYDAGGSRTTETKKFILAK